jgi:hypothetical protein
VEVSATSSNAAVVAPQGVTLGDNGQGAYVLQLTPVSSSLTCASDEPDCTFVSTTITVVATDNHDRQTESKFVLRIELQGPGRMIFRLDTGDGDDRHYLDNNFWCVVTTKPIGERPPVTLIFSAHHTIRTLDLPAIAILTTTTVMCTSPYESGVSVGCQCTFSDCFDF